MYQWTKKKIIKKYQKGKNDVLNYLEEVIRLKKTPEEIALGFAVGVFIGILPTPGFNVLLGLLTIFIWKKLNKFMLFAGMVLFNPFVSAPIIYFSHRVGGLLLPPVFPPDTFYGHLVQVLHTSARILAGSVIVGLIAAFISYFIIKKLAKRFIHYKNKK